MTDFDDDPDVLPPTWPDTLSYKQWARIGDLVDDCAITATVTAVQAAIIARCPTLADLDEIPADVILAALLWSNRLLARRNSPEGVVGVSDMGVVNVGRWDPDVGRLLAPWTAVVLA